MYLSRVELNARRIETMRALALPHLLHGAVEHGFYGKGQRNLWRVDWLGDTCYLLVLSAEKPDFSHVVEQFGYPSTEQPWQTKDYNILLERLREGQSWRFRLRANPTRSSPTEKDQASGRGKVFAHVTSEQQTRWLLMRAEACGFKLDENEFNVVSSQWEKFRKRGDSNREVTIRTATFEGRLIISETERFRKALLTGIGRAKAYGCGLLTITQCGE